MSLLGEYIAREAEDLRQQGVRVRVFGDLERLNTQAAAAVERVMRDTASGDKLGLNLFISYGGRAELVRAARTCFAADVKAGSLAPEAIDKIGNSRAIGHTADFPDP